MVLQHDRAGGLTGSMEGAAIVRGGSGQRDVILNQDTVEIMPKREDIEVVSIPVNTIADKLGSLRSANMVMVGAATPSLPIEAQFIEEHIREAFERKGHKMLEINLTAYRLGVEAVSCTAA